MPSGSKVFAIVSIYGSVFLRLALSVTFLAAVTDRFGWWGPPGAPNVAWGNLERFAAYAAILNPWAPPAPVPAIVWIVTVAETCFGCALILGFWTRWSALGMGCCSSSSRWA
jgi:uncharacterized membrane protein YphA (DoxX/SURF4 family)